MDQRQSNTKQKHSFLKNVIAFWFSFGTLQSVHLCVPDTEEILFQLLTLQAGTSEHPLRYSYDLKRTRDTFMYDAHEVFALLLATGVLLSLLSNRQLLASLPNTKLLRMSFYAVYLGFVCTVLEGFFWGNLLNIIEHISNNISIVIFVTWIWRLSTKREISR